MPVVGRYPSDKIDADGICKVGRVEIHEVVGSVHGNVLQDFLGEVTVRVNQGKAAPCAGVLNKQVAKEGRFPRTRFADDVKMVSGVRGRYAKQSFFASVMCSCANDNYVVVHIKLPGPASTPSGREV